MKQYTARTLIAGGKIRKGLIGNLLVAVPEKKFGQNLDGTPAGSVLVEYKDEQQVVTYDDNVARQVFDDKFTPGAIYAMVYFIWTPETQVRLL